jgi:hypothetical protein
MYSMKIYKIITTMLTKVFIVTVVLFIACGCEQQLQRSDSSAQSCLARLEAYGPAKLDVVKLSELKAGSESGDGGKLKVFVKAIDSCGSAIKAPCVFRVELYAHVARSPSPEGKRLEIWPDIDLTNPDKNNAQWRDYLRAYEFNFDVSSKLTPGHMYIVEVTCLSPMGKRLSVQYNLTCQK